MEKMTCPHCGEKFAYIEVKHVIEHVSQAEPIECPYCHREADKKITNGYFVTQKIEDYTKKD